VPIDTLVPMPDGDQITASQQQISDDHRGGSTGPALEMVVLDSRKSNSNYMDSDSQPVCRNCATASLFHSSLRTIGNAEKLSSTLIRGVVNLVRRKPAWMLDGCLRLYLYGIRVIPYK
jgi:hypothetical protein